MFCKECFEDISPDCMLQNNICVFCYYKIGEWDSNGKIVRKKDAIISSENLFRNYIEHYKKQLKQMENIFKELPKGSIKERIISGKKYYYLQNREGKKVKHYYMGKKMPLELIEKISRRKKLKNKILEARRVLFILRELKRPPTLYNRYTIFERDNFTCQYCGRKAPEVALEVDHVVPVSKGGTDDPSNLQTACRECNSQKRNR
jgi:5-methylcytosine-specific restriction endonuclease McrA